MDKNKAHMIEIEECGLVVSSRHKVYVLEDTNSKLTLVNEDKEFFFLDENNDEENNYLINISTIKGYL